MCCPCVWSGDRRPSWLRIQEKNLDFLRIMRVCRRTAIPLHTLNTLTFMEASMSAEHSTFLFRDVPGFPGYRIDTNGHLQSCLKIGGRVFVLTDQWRDIKGWLDGFGYRRIGLRVQGRSRSIYRRLHELVLLTFVGQPSKGQEACHNDGNRENNRLENLRWDTRKGNLADCLKHGTRIRGSKSPKAKLSEEKVEEAKKRVADGESRRKIAEEFEVAYSTIVNAVNGTKWRHVAVTST